MNGYINNLNIGQAKYLCERKEKVLPSIEFRCWSCCCCCDEATLTFSTDDTWRNIDTGWVSCFTSDAASLLFRGMTSYLEELTGFGGQQCDVIIFFKNLFSSVDITSKFFLTPSIIFFCSHTLLEETSARIKTCQVMKRNSPSRNKCLKLNYWKSNPNFSTQGPCRDDVFLSERESVS